jgi:hypothetical protein
LLDFFQFVPCTFCLWEIMKKILCTPIVQWERAGGGTCLWISSTSFVIFKIFKFLQHGDVFLQVFEGCCSQEVLTIEGYYCQEVLKVAIIKKKSQLKIVVTKKLWRLLQSSSFHDWRLLMSISFEGCCSQVAFTVEGCCQKALKVVVKKLSQLKVVIVKNCVVFKCHYFLYVCSMCFKHLQHHMVFLQILITTFLMFL